MDIKKFKKLPIIGILRGLEAEKVEPLLEAIASSGLKAIEITMNTPRAAELIRLAVKSAKGRFVIGAGTVLSMDDLRRALDAKATFIVMPVLVSDVMEYCVKNRIPVFPGALTPQEICNAWRAGATMVKVFPVKLFGSAYLKEIKAPLQDIELLACGGVNSDNIKSYFNSGASAVAFGASIFRKEWLAESKFSKMEESIKALIAGLGR